MICINGLIWYICFIPCDSIELMRSDGSYSIGCTDCNNLTIYVSQGLDSWHLRNVIRHELSHAIAYSYGWDYMPEYQEEELCAFTERYSDDVLFLTDLILNNL